MKITWDTPVKEESAFAQTSINTKKRKINKKGESECFHYGDPNHWAYEYPQLSEKERDEIITTKEKGGRIQTKVSEVVEDNRDSENGISMLVN